MANPIVVLPDLPGYTWRLLTPEDTPALYRLAQAAAQVNGKTAPASRDRIRQELEQAHSSLATDSLCAASPAGELVAYAWITFDERLAQEGRAFLKGCVHPAFRRRGLGGLLIQWMESRAQQVWQTHSAPLPLMLRIDFYDRGADAIALFERMGYHLAMAEDEMRRDLTQPIPAGQLPPGMALQIWTPQRAGQFFQVYQDAFRSRPGFPGWTQEVWVQAFTGYDEFRPDLSMLLLDGAQDVAYAVCSVEEGAGWIVQTGVRPAYRKRGLGGALLAETMRRFRAAGQEVAALSVNVNNPQAASVYHRLGFEYTRRYSSYRKALPYLAS
ncbi:MAG: GNAT family N-acetyltransferase [Chloroflexi bacterium]|nr:GNAT family N-acetyltransferase [Chloroflexota bacterium]